MRITTKMVNDAAVKAGVPINSNSLLDYVNGTASNNLMDTLKNENTAAKSKTSKSSYEKLEKAADELAEKAELLAGEDSFLFAGAKESGSAEEIYKCAEAMAEQFNELLKNLKSSSGTMNEFYREMLQELASDNSKALSGIGINVSKDGTMSIDKDKMKAADIDTLQSVLGGMAGFASKAAFLAGKISDHARANAESLSSQYDATGNAYSSTFNKYDFWG